MLRLVGIEPRTSDCNVLHAIVWASSLFADSLKTFRSLCSPALSIKNILSARINRHMEYRTHEHINFVLGT